MILCDKGHDAILLLGMKQEDCLLCTERHLNGTLVYEIVQLRLQVIQLEKEIEKLNTKVVIVNGEK